MATKKIDDLVNKIVFAVGNCHDGPSLWDHMRQDPEAFRSAVRHVLNSSSLLADRNALLAMIEEAAYSLDVADGFIHKHWACDLGRFRKCAARARAVLDTHKQADAPDQCQDCGAEIIGAHGCQGIPGDKKEA